MSQVVWLQAAPQAGQLTQHPEAALAAVEMLWASAEQASSHTFLQTALPILSRTFHADFVALVCAEAGQWKVQERFGSAGNVPYDFLADVLDRWSIGQAPADRGLWLAVPFDQRRSRSEVLLLAVSSAMAAQLPADIGDRLATLGSALGRSLTSVRKREQEQKRIHRLEAVLEIASQWNKTREMEPLLIQMAEAATKLLEADRASIFLWDKATHSLVARPALGVGEELRIPDNVGVVGQVLQTGESRRVDSKLNQHEIHRQVDTKTGYDTRTLLCVPMISRGGERFGCFEVLNKLEGNFTAEDEAALEELAAHASTTLENTQERLGLLAIRKQMTEQAAEGARLIGQSPAIQALRSTVQRVANTDLAVLILGENGTGKEVVSQSIHYLSHRRDKPFIAVNCAAIAESLLEAELFGHEKGAFTDAHDSRPGKFEIASGGTLFLDEIGDMTLAGQSKLLRVLEEKIVVRVGGSTSIHIDTRVLAATNQNLAEMVRQKKFREDLYFRLNVVTIELPPLRARGDDILLLAEFFLHDFCQKARRKTLKLSAEARRRLIAHGWPGNVRELRNLMERLAFLSQGDRIEAEDLAFILSPRGEQASTLALDQPLSAATDHFQVEYITQAISRVRGNMSEAAKLLGLHRSNLYRKMRQLNMDQAEET